MVREGLLNFFASFPIGMFLCVCLRVFVCNVLSSLFELLRMTIWGVVCLFFLFVLHNCMVCFNVFVYLRFVFVCNALSSLF